MAKLASVDGGSFMKSLGDEVGKLESCQAEEGIMTPSLKTAALAGRGRGWRKEGNPHHGTFKSQGSAPIPGYGG